MAVTAVTQPANGSLTFDATRVSFTPAANFNGSTTFSYTISDGNGGSDAATVTVNVTAVNDPPRATNDSFTVAHGAATLLDVLTNDSATPDTGETLTITAFTQPAGGNVSLEGSQLAFTPLPGFSGTTTFSYTIADGNGGTAVAEVTLEVTGNPAEIPALDPMMLLALAALLAFAGSFALRPRA